MQASFYHSLKFSSALSFRLLTDACYERYFDQGVRRMCCIAEVILSRLSRRDIPVAIADSIVQIHVNTAIQTITRVTTEIGEAQHKPL